MKKLEFMVRFVTPAFLGNAFQNGQWRTPPFKALLRQWWRVVKAKDFGYDHAKLREAEGELFGHAWLKNGGSGKTWAMRSQVRLKIDGHKDGTLKKWPNDPRVKHREVEMGGGNIGAHLYLGYGPLTYERGTGTALKDKHAIDANDSANLSVGYSDSVAKDMESTLKLISWFGTIGGRSRNGWGSLMLTGETAAHTVDPSIVSIFSRPLSDCLKLDWPHAFGKDQKGLLIWKTKSDFNTWSEVMKAMATIKIDFRTALPFKQARPGAFEDRHVLAYPVTNHPVTRWGNQSRLANQLRFKVTSINGKYRGIAYHLPCSVPGELLSKLGPAENDSSVRNQEAIWKVVHGRLDAQDSQMERIK